MRLIAITAAVVTAMGAVAGAQDDVEKKLQELNKWMRETRRQAEEKFRSDMEKLENHFRERAEQLRKEWGPRSDEPKDGGKKDAPGVERALERVIGAVRELTEEVRHLRGELDRLRRHEHEEFEFKFGQEMPKRLREFEQDFRKFFGDRGFSWERFEERLPRELREWPHDRLHRFFRERLDLFPKEFLERERERWFEDLRKFGERVRKFHDEPREEKRVEKREKKDEKREKKKEDEDDDF